MKIMVVLLINLQGNYPPNINISVSVMYPFRSDQKKTKVKKKTSNPHFEETFSFEVNHFWLA